MRNEIRTGSGITLFEMCSLLFFLAAQVHAGTFKAVDYGAVGDDSTDNTEAFSACLKAVR